MGFALLFCFLDPALNKKRTCEKYRILFDFFLEKGIETFLTARGSVGGRISKPSGHQKQLVFASTSGARVSSFSIQNDLARELSLDFL